MVRISDCTLRQKNHLPTMSFREKLELCRLMDRLNVDMIEMDEIRQIKKACDGHVLKVIIETCLLTEEEKKEMCRVVTEAGADYIKTSTGFSTGGATFADVKLMAAHVGPNVKIKAAGGISSFADAAYFTYLGADRLGTSRLVKIVKGEQSHETY